MTVPDTGARKFTLTPGTPAVLLTNNAPGPDDPATVISDDVAGCRVYLGTDGGVTDSNGVPLDPGTSMPWANDGPLYAYADPAGPAPATLRLTRAIDDWQPSPVAIAAQLAAQGVPSKLLTAEIWQGTLAAGASVLRDISSYASGVISASQFTSTGDLRIRQYDPSFGVLDEEVMQRVDLRGVEFRVQFVGTQLEIKNTGANPESMPVTVVGSNRAANQRLSAQRRVTSGDRWTLPVHTYANNETQVLTQDDSSCMLDGLVFCTVILPSTANGRMELILPSGQAVQFVTTAEMAASGPGLVTHFLMALPAGNYSIQFRAVAAQTVGGGGIVAFVQA